jgi:guanine deaminase
MQEALLSARQGMESNQGGPFGAVVVCEGRIIGRGCNRVTSLKDPTAHAEVMAIREACQTLGRFELNGCEIYSSCEPCPMCLTAIYWARLESLTYAGTQQDAELAGFDDAYLYREIGLPQAQRQLATTSLLRPEAQELFKDWVKKADRIDY